MVINQGDIFWIKPDGSDPSEANYPHPHVVIQEGTRNHSGIQTVVVCALTTNRKRASLPGNVLLEVGEANLPRQSVVVVSRVLTIDKAQLGEYIGSLSRQRVDQILAGMQFVQRLTHHHETGDGS